MSSPKPNQHVILAEEGDDLLGFLCAYGAYGADDPQWGTLVDNLHLRPDLHRHGVGKRLLAKVAAWCLTGDPAAGLYLWVLDQNARAQAFYQSLGATDVGSKTSTPHGGGSTITAATFGPPSSSPSWPRTAPI